MKLFIKRACTVLIAGSLLLGNIAIGSDNFAVSPHLTVSAAASSNKTSVINGVTYTYTVSNSVATITRIDIGSSCESYMVLSIPKKLGGYTVRTIAANATRNNGSKISALSIPDNILNIEDGAFDPYYCSQLKTVIFYDNIQRIGNNAFGGGKKISTVYIYNSSTGIPATIDQNWIENLSNNIRLTNQNNNTDCFYTCGLNGIPNPNSFFEILNALSDSTLIKHICEEKAEQLVSSLVPQNASDLQKMQIIYNYVVTSVRYSKFTRPNGEEYLNMRQAPAGTLFFHSGVCAGIAQAVLYLGNAAGLDVKYIANPMHAWNLFKPSDKSQYYLVDATQDKFCIGAGKTSEVFDGITYPTSTNYLGNSILVNIKNNNNRKFQVSLANTNILNYPYCSYSSCNPNDAGVLSTAQLPATSDTNMYMDSNTYYNLTIKDENGSQLFSLNCALNYGDHYSTSFYDTNGTRHSCNITRDSSNTYLNQKTDNNSYYTIQIN